MPYRPEAELKRPDLKGEFLCGHCGKTFCHAASLNRHRLNFHGDDQLCQLCHQQIPHNDTVRRHMLIEHQITRVFTCGCCNWTFPDKKELHSHNNSMLKTGTPGNAQAIAVSKRTPGSLSQHELRGEERTPRAKKRTSKVSTPIQGVLPDGGESILSLLNQLVMSNNISSLEPSTSAPIQAPNAPPAWLSVLLATQPALAPFISGMTSSSASSTTSSSETEYDNGGVEEPSGLAKVLANIANNNEDEEADSEEVDVEKVKEEMKEDEEQEAKPEGEEDDKDFLMQTVGADFLSVSTEQMCSTSVSSGGESGIGSAPHSNTPSPVSSDFIQNVLYNVKKANKRRSIDDICNKLVKKAC